MHNLAGMGLTELNQSESVEVNGGIFVEEVIDYWVEVAVRVWTVFTRHEWNWYGSNNGGSLPLISVRFI